jgi:hypothetical protein
MTQQSGTMPDFLLSESCVIRITEIITFFRYNKSGGEDGEKNHHFAPDDDTPSR